MLVSEPLQRDLKPAAKTTAATPPPASPTDPFPRRHIGPDAQQTSEMLRLLGFERLDDLIDHAVPPQIRLNRPLALPAAKSEFEALAAVKALASQNQVYRSFI